MHDTDTTVGETGVVLHPGQQISEYRVEKLLSESGLERVYLAAGAGGQVVIKVPRFEPSLNADFLRRFERQAATAARVSDPHVVRVLGSGQLPAGGVPFIVEEYVGGGSLQDMVALGPLDINAAVRICADAASGLDVRAGSARLVESDWSAAARAWEDLSRLSGEPV